MRKSTRRFLRRCARTASVIGIVSAASAFGAASGDSTAALSQEQWRESIAYTDPASEGCFMAEYPSTSWMPVGCIRAPDRPYAPKSAGSRVVGDGIDYAAGVTGLLSRTTGSFPVVTGVTSEEGDNGEANDYSLELNSNFVSTPLCRYNLACVARQQFIYSSGGNAVFMQYWVLNSGGYCAPGWTISSASCYKNSNAVFAPMLPISDLSDMTMTARAVEGGSDHVVFTAGGVAYSASGSDHVLKLATHWQQSEFNVFGDGNFTRADFNTGSHITVKIAVTDGSSNAPTCVAGGGTTGETNNLNLHNCTAAGGKAPHIQFTESN